jgi:L-ascorbate metabolism protein UlaG (beta-lactamase superfamily)
MKITKFGHCCLLLDIDGIRILTDPGMFTTQQNEVKNIDVIVITHEHQDHFHVESLKKALENTPDAKIITNSFVAGLLDKENIKNYEIVEDGQSSVQKGVKLEAYGTKHAQMHTSIPQTMNTGYFFADTLFYPGDAFTDPKRPVDILALPVAGPWMKISEAIDFALALKPTRAFPVHDALYTRPEIAWNWPSKVLPTQGIEFLTLEIGKEYEFN